MKRIVLCLSLMLFLVACSNKNEDTSTTQLLVDKDIQIHKLEVENEELQATLNENQTDFNYKKEETEYYKQLIDDLIKDYSNVQLKDLAIQLWNYELKINGVTVPTNGQIEIQENVIGISLIERQSDSPILPTEIFMQGKIHGDYIDHLKLQSNPSETYATDGTVVTGIHHKFVDVEKGSKIAFTITEELKNRLGLDTTNITVNTR